MVKVQVVIILGNEEISLIPVIELDWDTGLTLSRQSLIRIGALSG
jgi:hypothetical protein